MKTHWWEVLSIPYPFAGVPSRDWTFLAMRYSSEQAFRAAEEFESRWTSVVVRLRSRGDILS